MLPPRGKNRHIPPSRCRPSTNKTGKWSHKWEGAAGRAPQQGGNVVFAADPMNNFVALNASTGEELWHANLGSGRSGPISYELDGTQTVVVGAGDTLFASAMHAR